MRVKQVKRSILAALSSKSRGAVVAATFAALGASAVQASDLYWDANGTGAADGGSGQWLGAGLWATDPAGTSHVTWNNANGDDAKLPQPAASSTITFSGPIVANSIEYKQTTLGYTLQATSAANTLTLNSGEFKLSNGSNAGQTINAVVAGSNGLTITKNSAATVTNIIRFGSANSFTGDININTNITPNAGQFLRVSLDVPGSASTASQVNLNTINAQISAGGFDAANAVTVTVPQVNMLAGGNEYFGAFSNTAAGYNILALNGGITGTGDVNFQTSGGGGGGVVLLNSASTYTGQTYFNTGATGGSGGINRGWVVWGVNDAYPVGTTMNLGGIGGSLAFGTGALDLKGFSQTVASFGTTPGNTGSSAAGPTAGLTNSGAALSTLTITGGDTRVMNAPIGVVAFGSAISPGGANPSNISLVLAASHTGTLSLNNATAGNSGNTYSGATLVHGGTLLINGWNSSTTASATVDTGATLGGSGTYAGSITVGNASSKGNLVPGGVGTIGTFSTGALSLNPNGIADGTHIDYDFNTAGGDKIASTGSLTLPTAGTESITISYPSGAVIANGLFSLISYSGGPLSAGQFATLPLNPTVVNGGSATFTLQNNAGSLDVLVTGGVEQLVWKGPAGVGSGNWDTSTTNWVAVATPTTYANGKLVAFDDTANGTAGSTVTVTINNGGTAVVPYQAAFNNSTRNYVLTGTAAGDVIGGTAALIKSGTGSLTISRVQSYTGDTNINAGTLSITAGTGGLGSTNVYVNPAGTLSIASAANMTAPVINMNGGKLSVIAPTSLNISPIVIASSTLDIGSNNVTFSGGAFAGSSAVTKLGAGTLQLSTIASSYTGGWVLSAGTTLVDTFDGTGMSGLGQGTGNNSLTINNTATLQIKNGIWGDYRNSTSSTMIVMANGSTLTGSGTNSGYGRAGASGTNSGLTIVRGADSSNLTTVDIKTLAATDVFQIQNSLRQTPSGLGGVSNALVRVSGPGTVKLQDGGISSNTAYAGSWSVSAGVLQIGPVIYNPAGSGYGGPFGEPFNALGFAGSAANGDPDAPNPITLTGGVLALGIEQVNAVAGTNPNITTFPVNPTPNYLRTPITLNGGALAATANQVDYTTGDVNGDQGEPNANKVTANFGGDLTVQGTTSKILTYNPAIPAESRTVQLVGGSRTLATASPNFAANSTITYVTTWGGTLTVDPGTTTSGAGSFDIIRDAGTFVVAPTASLVILQNGTVKLGGAADSLNGGGSNQLNITNNSTVNGLIVTQGTKNVGNITGTGKTSVNAGVTVIANTIRQSNLTLDGTARVRASGGANAVTSNINTLVINTGGKFDISDNKVVTKSPIGSWTGAAYTDVTGLVASGRNGNTTPLWDGTTGIITTQAVATAGNLNSIGVAKASDVLPATATATASWGGQTITGTDTLVMYTYGGDATLDGKINIDDYVKIDSGIAGGYTGWVNGDFNYDGKVSIDDYITVIDVNVGNQSGVFPTGGGIDGGGLSGVAAVPEPASLSLLGLAAVGMMKRRRRSI